MARILKDNSTYKQKVALRKKMLSFVDVPVVMETHGGVGKLFDACYAHIEQGVVFEKSPDKSTILGKQRPTWAVYEADCVMALNGGAGAHLAVNFVDLDPYGEPWPAIDAFFSSDRPFPPRLVLAVHDGLRGSLKLGMAWNIGSLAEVVKKYGNKLHGRYLDICAELVNEKAAQAGYRLSRFAGYYCGHADQMTHYGAVLEK